MLSGTVARRAVGSVHEVARRLAGRHAPRRHGWCFVWSRAARSALERWRARRRPSVPLDAVTLVELPARVPGSSVRVLEPPCESARPPVGWEWPASFPRQLRIYDTGAHRRGQSVVEIPGGVVFGWRAVLGSDPAGVLTDASSLWDQDRREILAEAAETLAEGVEDLDGVTMSTWAGNAGGNYAHCLLQSIPRLDLLRRGFGLEADRYLVGADSPPAMFDALDILGVPADRRLLVPRQHAPAYRCARLRAATSPPFDAPWPSAFLRELFLCDVPSTASRRIYVRRESARRAILNEDAVIALLDAMDFEIVSMEGLTVSEQATTIAGAAAIVSAHGAALANLVFATPGAAVVELMGRNTASLLYAHLAWRLGLRYEMVMGTEPAPPDRWWTWQTDADTIVDVAGLRRSLECLGVA